jgi:histone-lysine N-methyltransferase SETMAR
MPIDKVHLRHCLLYEFNQNKTATQATYAICSVYGDDAVSARTSQRWFERFRDGNFDLDDEERSGRPSELKSDELESLLQENPRQSTRELAAQLNVNQSTVLRRLHEIGMILKVGKWVPYKLTECNITQRLNLCVSLMS